jgi:hypothetical protein
MIMYHLKKQEKSPIKNIDAWLIFGSLMLLWFIAPHWLSHIDETSGSIDQSIWLLIVLGLICFLGITAISWWLLHHFWISLGLPQLNSMALQFKRLELWQQLGFYWASFALLLLAALMSLIAIC